MLMCSTWGRSVPSDVCIHQSSSRAGGGVQTFPLAGGGGAQTFPLSGVTSARAMSSSLLLSCQRLLEELRGGPRFQLVQGPLQGPSLGLVAKMQPPVGDPTLEEDATAYEDADMVPAHASARPSARRIAPHRV